MLLISLKNYSNFQVENDVYLLLNVICLYSIHFNKYNCDQIIVYYNCCMLKNIGKLLHDSCRSFSFSDVVFVNTSKKIALKKTRNKQLAQLKRSLAELEPKKPVDLYEQYHHRDIYQKIDTDIEVFFHKRQYTLENFNFLINLLGQQRKYNQVKTVLEKMSILKVQPDEKTYNYLIRGAGISGDIEESEKLFSEACQRFGKSKYLYTGLIQCYTINNDPYQAEKLLQQMIDSNIIPDVPAYTTLINCFRKGRKLNKCWQIHKQLIKTGQQLDETYVGVMMKVYAATHDAEKVIKIYKEHIKQKGIAPMIETKNAYFKALASRVQYAPRVIEEFMNMVQLGQIINKQTVNWALKACSTIAAVRSAGQILKIAKLKEIPLQKSVYNSLIRTYAKACEIPNIEQQYRELMIMDAWKLIEEARSKNYLDTVLVNNLAQVYANSLMQSQIEGLVLPLYEKNGLEYNVYTFQILMKMYCKGGNLQGAMRIWTQFQHHLEKTKKQYIEVYGQEQTKLMERKADENLRASFKIADMYLETGIRLMDLKKVLQALQLFKKMDRLPRNQLLKQLGTMQKLPQQIQASLLDFKIQFGKVRGNRKGFQHDDPQNK